jgi:hypothetical protein
VHQGGLKEKQKSRGGGISEEWERGGVMEGWIDYAS